MHMTTVSVQLVFTSTDVSVYTCSKESPGTNRSLVGFMTL